MFIFTHSDHRKFTVVVLLLWTLHITLAFPAFDPPEIDNVSRRNEIYSIMTSRATTGKSGGKSSTTSGASAGAVNYIIYPKKTNIKSKTSKLTATLKDFSKIVHTEESKYVGILFWEASLTATQLKEVKASPEAGSVLVAPTKDSKYTDPFTHETDSAPKIQARQQIKQRGATADVRFFNWQQGHKFTDFANNFVYDSSAGSDVPLYIVDSGADLTHPEFTQIASKASWLFAGDDTTHGDNHHSAHGTCMLSKAAGNTLGVARDIKPIIVKVALPFDAGRYLQGVNMVSEAVGEGSGNTRAVLLMAWWYARGQTEGTVNDEWIAEITELLNSLTRRGVLCVTGSGNGVNIAGSPNTVAFGYPAGLALGPTPAVPGLLVAGAVELDGSIYRRSNRDPASVFPRVYAPGYEGMLCAGLNRANVASSGGTSLAAASTAGMAAYYLRLPHLGNEVSTPARLKSYLERNAWDRRTSPPRYPALWNLVPYSRRNQCIVQRQVKTTHGNSLGNGTGAAVEDSRGDACILDTISSSSSTLVADAAAETPKQNTLTQPKGKGK
ncbi:peptidase S8/S53 domain-containing protein [Calycina marina]|uniref:Peptidase S8/S53 domain-containing protein n=1 Tax=Calycina marina TaxID=1763456 RepID=A0A9P7Z5V8_9HELO|nr:peptidase S8/S53 domain-containing protein [Calycina marina]